MKRVLNITKQEVFNMEGISFVLIGTTVAKLCGFGGLVTSLCVGLKWFNTFDPSFKKKGNKTGGDTNDFISDHGESLRKKIRT
jgi:hypothetical protein